MAESISLREGKLVACKDEKWVTLREGRFSSQFDDSVTHLICSDEAFKAREPRGKFISIPEWTSH